MKRCAISHCRRNFENRSNAIAHFKENHTKNMILCFTCNKPIRSTYPAMFRSHHHMHPDIPMPFDFSERKKCWKEHAPLDEKVSYDSYNISFSFENEYICRNK